ncbi:MAG: rhodanese-like domain-containing protein [bacterium]|nr:rhodanese-like domain-containing protein [bacterium]
MKSGLKIAAFYKFLDFRETDLSELRNNIGLAMRSRGIVGTVILATEGLNATICGRKDGLDAVVLEISSLISSPLSPKYSYSEASPFRKVDVKIKPEIVTLKREVDIGLGCGTHVPPAEWNEIISDPEVILLDTRNDYEFKTGTFEGAVNPGTEKFSELPEYVAENLDPAKHKKVAMFCTGGIRCEKFAPYMRSLGFENVYQLEGGILKYLEEVPVGEQRWKGECYVFDTRVTVDNSLSPGNSSDLSQGE